MSRGEFERAFDPFDLRDPVSSHMFLSDDVQDQLEHSRKRKMKCQLCGNEFMGKAVIIAHYVAVSGSQKQNDHAFSLNSKS